MIGRRRALCGVLAGPLLLGTSGASAQCLAKRPVQADASFNYAGEPASSYSSPAGRVRVWWVSQGPHAPPAESGPSGIPDAVLSVAAAGDAALVHFEKLGFLPPISDAVLAPCSDNGGDERVDVYLFRFASSADGTIQREACSTATGVTRCRGFALVDSQFSSVSYDSFDEGARTVVPHELFHLVQAAHNADIEPWWSEGTAQWVTKHLYPDLTDLERFLPAYFSDPSRPLDAAAGGAGAPFSYATAIWPVFLHQRYDETLIVDTFEAMSQSTAPSTSAMNSALAARGSSLATEFDVFARYNAGTGSLAGSPVGYSDAAAYPDVHVTPLADLSQVSDTTASLSARYYRLDATGPRRVTVQTDSERNRASVIPVVEGVARLEGWQQLPALIDQSALIVVAGVTTKKSDAPSTLSVEAAPAPSVADGGDAGLAGPVATGAAPREQSACSVHAPRGNPTPVLLLLLALLGGRVSRRKDHRCNY